jgi:hypothetical protein
MSRNIDEVVIGENETRLVVKELTGMQCDAVFEKFEEGYTPSRLDMLMLSKFGLPEFALDMMCEPQRLAELIKKHDLAPSEYARVYEKALEVNPFLAEALQNFREKGEKVAGLQDLMSMMAGLNAR